MTDEETRRRWYAMRAKSERLLDAKVPEPTTDLFRPDALEAWAAGMPPKPEPEPVKPTREIASRTEPAPAPIDWAAVDARIEAAISAEHEFMIEVMGGALGESLRDQRQEKDELAAEVRKLWAVLTELQMTIAALTRIGVTGKAGEVLDLPALPGRNEMN